MSEQIEAGEGWRLLGPDEVVRDGDETWHRDEERWVKAPMQFPYTAKSCFAVRRRIPAKPEWFSGKSISTYENGPLWLMETGEEKTLLDPNEAREFAAWLTRYAEWREAQEGEFK
jgi:hypothetical protein